MRLEIRNNLVQTIQPAFVAQFPGVPITWPNQPFDSNEPPPLYVDVEIEYQGSEQINLGERPRRRYLGDVFVTVYCKQGTGTLSALGILDWFESLLGSSTVGVCQFKVPEPQGPSTLKGWHSEQTAFSFWADEP